MKLLTIIVIYTLLQGCSTIATIAASEENFNCHPDISIPRIYSGISNDIRFLRAEQSEDTGLVIFDMPFSLVADTVALPYTIYSQIRYGNLCN